MLTFNDILGFKFHYFHNPKAKSGIGHACGSKVDVKIYFHNRLLIYKLFRINYQFKIKIKKSQLIIMN